MTFHEFCRLHAVAKDEADELKTFLLAKRLKRFFAYFWSL